MHRTLTSTVVAIMVVGFSSSVAYAVLDLTLELDTPSRTVAPDEIVEVFATLTNEQSSDELLTGVSQLVFLFGLGTLYDSVPDAGNPYSQESDGALEVLDYLLNEPLRPGESLPFLWSTLSPDAAPVAPGVYSSNLVQLQFYLSDSRTISARSSADVTLRVVPEPDVIALIGLILFPLAAKRSANKRLQEA